MGALLLILNMLFASIKPAHGGQDLLSSSTSVSVGSGQARSVELRFLNV